MGYNLEDEAVGILNNAAEDKCTCASSVTPANWPVRGGEQASRPGAITLQVGK